MRTVCSARMTRTSHPTEDDPDPAPLTWREVPGGLVEVGHDVDDPGFAYDNEGPRHRRLDRHLAPTRWPPPSSGTCGRGWPAGTPRRYVPFDVDETVPTSAGQAVAQAGLLGRTTRSCSAPTW